MQRHRVMYIKRSAAGTVGEVMRGHFITSAPDENPLEADQTMRLARLRQMLVVEDGILVGLLPQRPMLDQGVMELLLRPRKDAREYLRSRPVKQAMLPAPQSVVPRTPLEEAALKLLKQEVACLPVVVPSPAGPRLIGLVTQSDLLRTAYV